MARILLAWELGGGLGHLANLTPLAEGLVGRGHYVAACLADLSGVHRVFPRQVACFQAPLERRAADQTEKTARTFAHVLLDNGFADPDRLGTMTAAWRNLCDLIRPDLIVFDHAPTALLAARGYSVKKVLIGTAFFTPADTSPLANLHPWQPGDAEESCRAEDRVLANANHVLAACGQGSLERVAQLYREVGENFLTSFAEFDPYPARQNATYWGPMLMARGKQPAWPEGRGKRIYAYLKPFPSLPRLFALLNELACPTIVYCGGLQEALTARFQSKTLCFERERLDQARIAAECDVAILNGGAASTAAFLLAGKPILQIPIYVEQGLNAVYTSRLGAGLGASPERPEQIAVRLMSLLQSDRYAEAARAFAARHRDFDPQQQVSRMLARIEELLQTPD